MNGGIFIDILVETSYTQSGLNNKAIALLNPFRYRSYYYDEETGLYYLNSRYYDPETGRFINADKMDELNSKEINGLNLYSFCGNNPGRSFWKKFFGWLAVALVAVACIALIVVSFGTATPLAVTGMAAGIAGLVGMGTSFISQGISNGWSNINSFQVAFNGVLGMASGAAMASPLGWIASGLIVGGIGFVNSVGNDLFNYGGDFSKVNWGKAALIGATSSLVAGAGKYIATNIKLMNAFSNSTNAVKQAALRSNFFAGSSLGRMAYQEFWTIVIEQQALFRSAAILISNTLRGGVTFGINTAW